MTCLILLETFPATVPLLHAYPYLNLRRAYGGFGKSEDKIYTTTVLQ